MHLAWSSPLAEVIAPESRNAIQARTRLEKETARKGLTPTQTQAGAFPSSPSRSSVHAMRYWLMCRGGPAWRPVTGVELGALQRRRGAANSGQPRSTVASDRGRGVGRRGLTKTPRPRMGRTGARCGGCRTLGRRCASALPPNAARTSAPPIAATTSSRPRVSSTRKCRFSVVSEMPSMAAITRKGTPIRSPVGGRLSAARTAVDLARVGDRCPPSPDFLHAPS